MNERTSFRAALAYRILAGLGVASAVVTIAACGDQAEGASGAGGSKGVGGGGGADSATVGSTSSSIAATTGSAGGSASTSDVSSSAASTGSGMQSVERCFYKADAMCPDPSAAEATFGACTVNGEMVTMWLSGPTVMGMNCCYIVDVTDPGNPACGIPGRPFVVEGRPRVAKARAGVSGWAARGAGEAKRASPARLDAAQLSPRVADLDGATRGLLAQAWASDATYEHASVASFGKLALELLALGAPADLIRAAHKAALEEIGHAEMGFALASAYLGERVGPGPLTEARSFTGASTLIELAVSAMREGCFGETLAAVVASAQRDAATDPAVREVLAIVAEEEGRHAELAFRIVAWAIATGGHDVHQALHLAYVDALDETRRAASSSDTHEPISAAARAHGRLSMKEINAERLRAADEVVIPAMAHLLMLEPG